MYHVSASHMQAIAACVVAIAYTVSIHLPALFPCRQGYRSSTKKAWEDRTQPLVRSRCCCKNTAFTGPAYAFFFVQMCKTWQALVQLCLA